MATTSNGIPLFDDTTQVAPLQALLNAQSTALDTAITNQNANIETVTPKGSVIQFAGSTAPSGWLLCDGTAVSRTTYADLFAIIGTTYGAGNGSSTFNLPNLKGRVAVGRDNDQEEFNLLGETGGLKSTRHAFLAPPINSTNAQDAPQGYLNSASGDIDTYLTGGGSSNVTRSVVIRSVGGQVRAGSGIATEVGHYRYTSNNLQPYVVMNYIIKAL